MDLPEKIELKLKSGNAIDLSNVIVEMKVQAGRKNPYYIQFPKTDRDGFASLEKNDFIGQFKDHWDEALMDYDGTPETADPIVEISLFDSSWLEENKKAALSWPLLKHEKHKWRSRREQYDYLTSTSNHKFECERVVVDLGESNQIVLPVKGI